MVILNKTDYTAKMNFIFEDQIKFLTLCPSNKHDNTSKIESRMQRSLLQLHEDNLLPTNLYELIRPSSSGWLCIYGLLKTHKKDVPLRPILSVIGSVQHQGPNISSNRFSLSSQTTAYRTLLPLLILLKPQIWTLPPSFSVFCHFEFIY